MAIPTSRKLALAGGILILWVVTAAILMSVIPGPHQKLDYLVIGAVSTFLAMIVLFFVLLQGWVKTEDPFYKLRARAAPPESEENEPEKAPAVETANPESPRSESQNPL